MKRKVRTALAILVSSGLLAWLLSRLELGPALDRLSSADARGLMLGAVFSLLVLLLRALRFSVLTRAAGLGVTAPAVAIQVFLNRVTPLRLGELSLPLLLRRHAGEDLAASLVGLVFVRLLDLAIVVWAIGLALAAAPSGATRPALLAGSLGLVVLVATFRHWLGALVRSVRALFARLVDGRWPTAARALDRLLSATLEARRLSGRDHAAIALTSLGIFFGQTAMFGAILSAYGIRLPLLSLVRGSAVVQAGAALPIAAVGTFGTHEASWVAGFAWVGLPVEEAIVTGVAAQVATLAYAACFALLAWLWLSRRRPPALQGN
mgnify:CR=1 FL=1